VTKGRASACKLLQWVVWIELQVCISDVVAHVLQAIGAVSYAGYSFLSKGESGSSSDKNGGGSSGKPKNSDDALEEARRIMDKYK
jgi:hypothetical protein